MTSYIKYIGFVAIMTIANFSSQAQDEKLFDITKNIELFANTYQQLNTRYVDDIDPSVLMRIGIDAMVHSLDPYTVFYSESQIESYKLADKGKYQGIGAIMDVVGDYVTIVEPYEGGPALKAGLQAGDQLIMVNGFDTKGKSLEEVDAISRGLAGTNMEMKIKRLTTGETLDISLTRGEVSIPNVPYSGRIADNIGYISLTTFTQDAGKNIADALADLKKAGGLDGLVLDLRSNGGGLLREAVTICNLFIPTDMEVVTTKGKNKEEDRTFKTTKPPMDLEIPIVVLTNDYSASASEIVSGTLQDYDRGVIMGQRTYGKGLVQNFEEVGYNSRVKITTSKYYIPSRRCIQAVEYENGEPVDIADEKRTKFKTANGRTVLDGGGVAPDVKLPKPELSEYTKSLNEEKIIFGFVNQFVGKNDSIVAAGDFRFTAYDDFKKYVNKNDFNFESKIEKEIKKLQEDAPKEVAGDMDELMKNVKASHTNDLEQFKKEITKEIEMQIVSRYYYQSGKAIQKLNGDTEIQEAIKLLNDKQRYNKILSGK